MKRAVLAILLLLAVFLVALAGWVFFRPEDPNDPVVNGERMSFWISQLGSEDAHTRAFAAENVGSVGPRGPREAAIPALMRLLEDPIPQVRRSAARALPRVAPDGDRARKALPVLLEALQDPDENVRFDTARMLGGLLRSGDKEAVAPLGQALTDRSLRVRHEVVDLLGRIGPAAEETVPALVEMLEQQSLRPSVIEVLGRIGPRAKDAVPALVAALKEGPPVDIKKHTEISPGFGKGVVHKSVRMRAVIALGQIGPEAKDALPALIEAYRDENESFRQHVAAAITAIDPATAKKLRLQL